MAKMLIKTAINSDKSSVLNFCTDTFSWGDYIKDVWDYWLTEENLFLIGKQFPVGMCHVSFYKNQMWIEGIRIDPNFRRHGLASELIKHVELLAKEKHVSSSHMLIEAKNSSSLLMAQSLDYRIFQTWNFYTLLPQSNPNHLVQFGDFINAKITHYVNSWRWLVLDEETLFLLSRNNKIILSNQHGLKSIAILTDSEHFDKVLIVTLYSGSQKNTLNLVSYIQNYGAEKNYKKIQILTKETLPFLDTLKHQTVFNLMQKFLC